MFENALPSPTFAPASALPGDTVQVSLRFTNCGDVTLDEARLFLTSGNILRPIEDTGRVNGLVLFGVVPFLDEKGFALPSMAAGSEVSIQFAAMVAAIVNDEDDASLRATVAFPDGSSTESPAAMLEVRSAARLSCIVDALIPSPDRAGDASAADADTNETASIDPNIVTLKYRVTNAGSRRADAVQVQVPTPQGCESLAGDAALNSDPIAIEAGEAKTIALSFRVVSSQPHEVVVVPQGKVLLDGVVHCTAQTLEVRVPSQVSFENVKLTAAPSAGVSQGDIVEITLQLPNCGRSDALNVPVTFLLPEGTRYIPTSATIDGRPARSTENKRDARRCDIVVGRIPRGATTLVSCKAVVERITVSEGPVTFRASFDGTIHEAQVAGLSVVEFAPNENYIQAEKSIANPGDALDFAIVVQNTGTAISHDVRLRVANSAVRFLPSTTTTGIDYDVTSKVLSRTLMLGSIKPGDQRRVPAAIDIPKFFDEGAEFSAPVFLSAAGVAEQEVGTYNVRGRASISFAESGLEDLGDGPLRFGESRMLRLRVVNSGSMIARGVRVAVDLPADVVIENVAGAEVLDGDIQFKEVGPGCIVATTIQIRFTGQPNGLATRALRASISSLEGERFEIAPLPLHVLAQASIVDKTVSIESQGAGEPYVVHVGFRNIGDGIASRVRIQCSDVDGYISGSTTLPRQAVRDVANESPLKRGLSLEDVLPGEAIELSWLAYATSADVFTIGVAFTVDDEVPTQIVSAPYQPELRALVGRQLSDSATSTVPAKRRRSRASSSAPSENLTAQPVTAAEIPAPASNTSETRQEAQSAVDEAAASEKTACEAQATGQGGATTAAQALRLDLPLENQSTSKSDERTSENRLFAAELNSPLTEKRVGSTLRVAEALLKDNRLGWYRHVLALRLFLAEDVALIEPADEVLARYTEFRANAAVALGQPRLKVMMPNFEVSPEWVASLEDDETAKALDAFLVAIAPHLTDEYESLELGYDAVTDALPASRVAAGLEAPGRGTALWAYTTMSILIPTACRKSDLDEALKEYASSCREFFAELNPETAYETMSGGSNAALDHALVHVVELLQELSAEVAAA